MMSKCILETDYKDMVLKVGKGGGGVPWWLSGKECTCQSMQERRVQSLGRGDLLEKEMSTHSSVLAWRIPWKEESGRLQPIGL